jgi:SH3-like domain-containing protein
LILVLGVSVFLFSSRSVLAPTAVPGSASDTSTEASLAGAASTRTQEPITPGVCIKYETVRIRRGPGAQYETIGGVSAERCLTIIGRNAEATWVYIVSDDGQTGWVNASLVRDAGDLERVSVRDHSASINTARPTLTTEELAHGAQVYLTSVAATNLPQSPLTRYLAPCFTIYLPTVEQSPTLCNDRPSPDQSFVLVVLGQDWSEYDGQCLVVEGYLQIAGGALQIQALDRSQVSLCE